jgi:uncharacterized RDD family membrane protein YckC
MHNITPQLNINPTISYVGLFPRLLSTMVDLFIIAIIVSYPMKWISLKIFTLYLYPYIAEAGVSVTSTNEVIELLLQPSFVSKIAFSTFVKIYLSILSIQVLFASIYFISFWTKFGCTPGKYIFKQRVLREKDMKNLSIIDSIYRLIGTITFLFSLWSIIFTTKKKAIHDIFAGSVVINK